MNAYHKRQKQKKRNGFFRKWHRRLGFVASLFLLNLAITGVLINHYESLSLHKSYVTADWLLALYDVSSPESAQCFSSNEINVCQMDRFIYLNDGFWREVEGNLLGVIQQGGEIAITTDFHIFIISEQLALIDQVSIQESLAIPDASIKVSQSQILAETATQSLVFNLTTTIWETLAAEEASELIANNAFAAQGDSLLNLQTHYRQNQISQLKLLQDLHSGRLFGLSGQIVNDITALILILLGLSGVITWRRSLKNR